MDGSRLATACATCEMGRFQDVSEQASCIECAEILPFSFTAKMGATKFDDCVCKELFPIDGRIR